MGICRYCGQSAGLFRTVHSECRERFLKGSMSEEEILFELDDKTGKIGEVSREEFDRALQKGGHAAWMSIGISGSIGSPESKQPRHIYLSEKPFEQLQGLPKNVKEGLVELMKEAMSTGESLETLTDKVESLLDGYQYSWSAFDTWCCFFEQRNKWPEMWRMPLRVRKAELQDLTKSERERYWLKKEAVRSKTFLLTHTITSELYSYHRYRSFLDLGVLKFEILGLEGDGCPVCVKENGKVYDIDGAGKLPPFHPGCRCVAISGR